MVDYIEKIAQADEIEIEQLLNAIRQRYAELFPDWELNIISLSKVSDPGRQLDKLIDLLETMKNTYEKSREYEVNPKV